ncbi:MAG: type secretion system protein ImpA [Acetobacteraceae bacterium]|jgi:type VI secretion system protein ImpA|nr:type secretion system protein ImpA [Acetobacteraceae bacterium]
MRSVGLPEGFDLDALLAPIPGALPHGTDLREDYTARSPYSRLRDARSEARDAEKQLEAHDPDTPPADPAQFWRILRELGTKLLIEQTKDLEIAAWLTEALVRSDGLAGLAAGSRLIAGLADRYWDDIYPLPDDYGIETRTAPIMGLNGRDGGGSLMAPLFRMVLFNRADGTPVALHQYQASARLATMETAARQQRILAGAVPFDDIEKDARTVGRPAMAQLRDAAAEALADWQAMAAVLDAKAGADAPSTSHVRDLVREIGAIASRYAPAAQTANDLPVAAMAVDTQAPDQTAAASSQTMTRESALRSLEALAAFFRETEPHSPLSYTLDEAVRRARLPWLELLEEVIGDRGSRDAFLTTLGIRPPPAPE